MIVSELIKELQEFDGEMEVLTSKSCGTEIFYECHRIEGVREVEVERKFNEDEEGYVEDTDIWEVKGKTTDVVILHGFGCQKQRTKKLKKFKRK
jgi:hypothetical protein